MYVATLRFLFHRQIRLQPGQKILAGHLWCKAQLTFGRTMTVGEPLMNV